VDELEAEFSEVDEREDMLRRWLITCCLLGVMLEEALRSGLVNVSLGTSGKDMERSTKHA